jgi:metal-responsive CopG/Arc/MetJ family transcriptional regulator
MTIGKPKRQRGRPPKEGDTSMEQIAIRLPKEMLEAIANLASGRLARQDRSTVIRELLDEAIEARMARKKKGGA